MYHTKKVRMKKLILLFLAIVCLSSCATIINSPNTKIKFFSQDDPIVFSVDKLPGQVFQTDTMLSFKRDKKPIELTIYRDSLPELHYTIDSRFSSSYGLGNLFAYYIGYLIDLTNKKMYTYPGGIEMEREWVTDSSQSDKTTRASNPESDGSSLPLKEQITIRQKHIPGKLNYTLYPLTVSSMNWEILDGRDIDNWAMGFGFDVNCYLKKQLRLQVGMEWMYHRTGGYREYFDYYSKNTVDLWLVKLQVGKPIYKNFWIDGGLQVNQSDYYVHKHFSTFDWNYSAWDYCYQRHEQKVNLGLALSLRYLFGRCALNLNYYPSFVSKTSTAWEMQYNHIISLSFSFAGSLIQ